MSRVQQSGGLLAQCRRKALRLLDKLRKLRHGIRHKPCARPAALVAHSGDKSDPRAETVGVFMRRVNMGLVPFVAGRIAAGVVAVAIGIGGALAQTGAPDQAKQPAAANPSDSAAKSTQAQFNEAAQAINGPAGNPECVWLGRNAVGMMLRDDLDTAFRHLDLYDRFGCPGGHIQATFRCVARFGIPDVKATEATKALVHSCWINPAAQPQPVAATAPAPANAAPPAPSAPAQVPAASAPTQPAPANK